MTIELTMPALSPTMEKGTIAKWLVSEGDAVKPGDLLAEIETDKATMEYEAVDAGVVASLLIAEGTEDVSVGTVIAIIGDPGQAAATPARAPVAPPEPTKVEDPAPAREVVAEAAPEEPAKVQPTRQTPADRIKVSPLAQRIADSKGIDLRAIKGSGPNGRIVRADLGLTRKPALSTSETVPSEVTFAPPPAGVPLETVKLTTMRKTIARRLTESKSTVPHFYLTARVNLDPLLALRAELNAALASRSIKLSVNDFMIKALGLALAKVPDANVQFGGDVMHRFARADISMAVAIDGGLVTPVIRDAGALSLTAIAQSSRELAEKARSGRLTPEDYDGGTASISNLGMFGIDGMLPVINPPQALILGVAAGIEQPWKVGGELGLATVMSATASFDHRAIDGAVAAEFMAALRELIETPLLLVS